MAVSVIKKTDKFSDRAPTISYNQTRYQTANYCRAYVKSGWIFLSGYCCDNAAVTAGTVIVGVDNVYPMTTGASGVSSFSVPCQCDDGSCDFINIVPGETGLQIINGRQLSANKYIRYTAAIPSLRT